MAVVVGRVRAGVAGAVVALLFTACQPPGVTLLPGNHLYWDGNPIPIRSACVRSETNTCQPKPGTSTSYTVVCNLSTITSTAGEPNPGIYVTLVMPGFVAITAGGVNWTPGKSSGGFTKGGVTHFDARKGANVDVIVSDPISKTSHHLSGKVSCT
jgi:hypothetical protein